MAPPNSSLMRVVLSSDTLPLARLLKSALAESRWQVEVAPQEAEEAEGLPAADALILVETRNTMPMTRRVARAEALLAGAARSGIGRVVLLSDLALYEPGIPGPIYETAPLVPDAKGTPAPLRALLRIEALVRETAGIETAILRLPQLYDRTDPEALAEIRDILTGTHPRTDRPCFQRLHPDDLAQAVRSAARRREAAGETFNIVEPMALAPDVLDSEIARLGRLLTDAEATEDRVRPEHHQVRPVHASDKARRLLDFRPVRPVWVGLAQCVQQIAMDMRAAGDLPPNRPRLPPLLSAIETRSNVLSGTCCVVADATSEIGREVALLLSRCGAEVIALGGDAARGAELMAELDARPSCTSGSFQHVDVARMSDLRSAGAALAAAGRRVDALLHCASGYFETPQDTEEGIDRSFAVNYLSAFQFVTAFLPVLAEGGHVITTSTNVHKGSGIDFGDLFCRQDYNPADAFARAKFASLMFSHALMQRAGATGARVVSVNAGLDPLPRARRRGSQIGFSQERFVAPPISAHKAATHIASVLVDPSLSALTGLYVDQDRPGQVDPNIRHDAACERLWQVSEALVEMT